MNAKLPPPQSPAHYWQIATVALADEQRDRLRSMHDIDGLLALNRLTMGHHAARANRFEKESDATILATLFKAAYVSRL